MHMKSLVGMLPLHYACLVPIASVDIVSYLIECYPEAIRVPDCHNRLPLHIACHQNTTVPIETIQYLVRAWPHSVQVCYERNPTTRDCWDSKGDCPWMWHVLPNAHPRPSSFVYSRMTHHHCILHVPSPAFLGSLIA